jgi:hypothetical protein
MPAIDRGRDARQEIWPDWACLAAFCDPDRGICVSLRPLQSAQLQRLRPRRQRALVVQQVTAKPRVNFITSSRSRATTPASKVTGITVTVSYKTNLPWPDHDDGRQLVGVYQGLENLDRADDGLKL